MYEGGLNSHTITAATCKFGVEKVKITKKMYKTFSANKYTGKYNSFHLMESSVVLCVSGARMQLQTVKRPVVYLSLCPSRIKNCAKQFSIH